MGVSLVLIPHFPKTYVTGATFWESKGKAVIMMSFRGSWADIFWFSLFHEVGHILLHDKRAVFIEGKAMDSTHKKQEQEADDFSRDCLISTSEYECFINENAHNLCEETITCFAQEAGIHAGIVTGRLRHDALLHVSQHLCRVKYKWASFNPFQLKIPNDETLQAMEDARANKDLEEVTLDQLKQSVS